MQHGGKISDSEINKTEVIVKEIIGMSFFFISINQNMSFRANLVDLIKTGKY